MKIAGYFGKHIGIVGAGIAGLHLGLRLRQMGIACTIISDRTPQQVASGRLANTVVHWPATLRRERVLRVCHWSADHIGFDRFQNIIESPQRIEIQHRAAAPARAVDYRIYLPRLMEDFVDCGGRLEISRIDAADIGCVAARFDLVVVAATGNGFGNMFARDLVNSPYDRPQRWSLVGLFTGFHPTQSREGTVSVAPGLGEAILFPILSRSGLVRALFVSAAQADHLAMLGVLSCSANRAGFRAALLSRLEQLHPTIYDQIDTARFDPQGPDDLVQVAVTPIVRHPIAELGDGTYAIALGDAHATLDPLLAQGANIGSYSAFVLADAIAEATTFDLAFCREVERCRSARIFTAARWTNAFLRPADETRVALLRAMSRNQRLADTYFDNFNRPEQQWERVCSPESIRAWLGEMQIDPAPPTQVSASSVSAW